MTQRELANQLMGKSESQIFEFYGWKKYYDFWIKQSWVDEGLPYDRMAVDKECVLVDIKKQNELLLTKIK